MERDTLFRIFEADDVLKGFVQALKDAEWIIVSQLRNEMSESDAGDYMDAILSDPNTEAVLTNPLKDYLDSPLVILRKSLALTVEK